MRYAGDRRPVAEVLEPRVFLSASPVLQAAFASAETLSVSAAGSTAVSGNLGNLGDIQTYGVTARAAGTMIVDMKANGSPLDPYLEIYNTSGSRLALNDNASAGTRDGRVTLRVSAGQTFYIRSSGARMSTGDYSLSVASLATDDFGNAPAAAKAVSVGLWQTVSVSGLVNYAGDNDVFTFIAPTTGTMQIAGSPTGRANALATSLSAYDGAGGELAHAGNLAGVGASLGFDVIGGSRYYIQVTGQDGSTGTYKVTLHEDPAAQLLNVPPADSLTVAGQLAAGAAPMYYLTAPANGTLAFDMRADGSSVDSYLSVYNTSGRVVAQNDNAARGTLDSRVTLRVTAGQTFYVGASGRNGSAGAYALSVASLATDDYGNTPAAAKAVGVGLWQTISISGLVNYAGDNDVFTFIAPATGTMQVAGSLTGRINSLAAGLRAYDGAGLAVAPSGGLAEGGGRLAFDVTAGGRYYIRMSGENGTSGAYKMTINEQLAPEILNLAPADTVVTRGEVVAGSAQLYYVTAPATGTITFDMKADGSSLDSYLRVYNTSGRLVAQNDNAGSGTLDSRVTLRVTAGQSFYVGASGQKGSAGAYSLSAQSNPTDDYGNTLEAAKAVSVPASRTTGINGTINYVGDVDVLAFVAPATGTVQATESATGNNNSLSAAVFAYDGNRSEIASDTNSADAGAALTFDVTKGTTYYVKVAGLNGTAGTYRLNLYMKPAPAPAPTPPPPPPPPPTPPAPPDPTPPAPDPTPPPPAEYVPGTLVTAVVATTGSVTQLVVIGTDGADPITVSQAGEVTSVQTRTGTLNFSSLFPTIVIYGFAGDDTIRITNSVTAAVTVSAGDGNDTIYAAGMGADTLSGGAGDDLLVSVGGGRDQLGGGDGTDSFWADTTDTVADTSAAETAAKTVHTITQFYLPTTSAVVPLEIAGQSLLQPTASYAYADFSWRTLFVDGPQFSDIRQGAVGDCYFMASLASLADQDPGVIRQMIAPMGDGTYAVRFYRSGQPVYVRVDAQLPAYYGTPAYAKLSATGELWGALAEKAYAQFRYGANSYSSLNGGWMSTVYQEVTGAATTDSWISGSGSSTAQFISSQLTAGHALSAGTSGSPSGPFAGSHAYMIKSIETAADGTYVTVYNPWGFDGYTYTGDTNSSDGLLRVSMAMFQSNFTVMSACLA